MKQVRYERGRIIDSPPEVVACLWSNWEIYDALLDNKFRIARTKENVWAGHPRGFLRVSFSLISREASLQSGKFVYAFSGSIAALPSSTVAILRYEASGVGKTSVHGEFTNELPTLASLLEPLVRRKITRAVDEVIEGGQVSCELISKNYDRIKSQLPKDYLETIDDYLNTAKRLRHQPFANPLFSSGAGYDRGDESHDPGLQEIQRRLNSLQIEIGVLAEEIRRSIAISQIDPASAMTTNRRIVEGLVKRIFKDEQMTIPKDAKMLGSLLSQLKNKSTILPNVIYAHMNTVLELGNVGAHLDVQSTLRQPGFEDYKVSVNSLLYIVEWYFLEYGKPHEKH